MEEREGRSRPEDDKAAGEAAGDAAGDNVPPVDDAEATTAAITGAETTQAEPAGDGEPIDAEAAPTEGPPPIDAEAAPTEGPPPVDAEATAAEASAAERIASEPATAEPSTGDPATTDEAAPPVAWAAPSDEPTWPPQGFTVGGTLGLTLDTYGRHWPTFVSLALVPALLAGLAALDRSFGPVSIVAIAVAGIVALVTTGAVTAGTDDHLSSRPLAAGPLLRTGLRRTPALFGAAILMGLFAGLVSLVAVPIVFFATREGVDPLQAGAIILGLALVAAVALWYVFTRLALFTPAIVLADRGPVAGIAESWRVTRGHVLRLIGLLIIVGLLTTFATSGAAGIATFSPNRLIGALATVLATAIVLPVLSIASAVAYGLVTDRWRDAPAPAREGSPRRSALALLLGVGLLMSVVGAVFSVQFLTSTFLFGAPPDAGLVVAGTDRDPDAPCRPLNRTTEFTTTDPIYIAAYFSKPLQPGETADVTFFVDGQQAQTLAIAAEAQRVGCYYEQDAIQLAPGTYRLLIERGQEVLADGEFVVR